jgi:hypothetical protein
MGNGICIIFGCWNPADGRELCRKHRNRLNKTGTTLRGVRAKGQGARTHGHTRLVVGMTRTYNSWSNMIQRTTNPNRREYPRYGGRGIRVTERWLSPGGFAAFLADMGERPEGKTLDRIDNSGNYEPGNCRWSSPKEQQGNRRNTPR